MADDADAVTCSRCGGETEAGGMRDSYHWMKPCLRFQTWVWPIPPGPLSRQMLPITTVKRELKVVAHRCRACGHLDLFAKE